MSSDVVSSPFVSWTAPANASWVSARNERVFPTKLSFCVGEALRLYVGFEYERGDDPSKGLLHGALR
jgi:hypothetical protein